MSSKILTRELALAAVKDLIREEIGGDATVLQAVGMGMTGGAPRRRRRARRMTTQTATTGTLCGVKGCGQHAKSKGYCVGHYLKFRNMIDRHPEAARLDGWVENPQPQTVNNTPLPRGRAARKVT